MYAEGYDMIVTGSEDHNVSELSIVSHLHVFIHFLLYSHALVSEKLLSWFWAEEQLSKLHYSRFLLQFHTWFMSQLFYITLISVNELPLRSKVGLSSFGAASVLSFDSIWSCTSVPYQSCWHHSFHLWFYLPLFCELILIDFLKLIWEHNSSAGQHWIIAIEELLVVPWLLCSEIGCG